ncbi:hypothetical protein MesoLj131c_62300 [Mesorhizobium sp. 131-3-5]|uniref:hypothetical protein n=1 Tax=Mesorhizobium sp. 131-3-5 TaxID=2744520 RepID=UPI0019276917|nr:hypothetical protein [Mesorhizobium sp. 131-3-5]BCH11972.1 hypothetical protein MesoLj131c_62300 [Mesorhizobium sp. 131-3-5]
MTTAHTFELKAISYNSRLSEETSCYSAKLYMDGKHIADVGNRGHGGCDEQHPINRFDLDALNLEIKATYPKTVFHGMEFDQDLESICGDLLSRYLTLRDIRRPMGKAIVFLAKGDAIAEGVRTMKYKVTMTPEMKAQAIANVNARYPGALILNDMTDDEIMALVAAQPVEA